MSVLAAVRRYLGTPREFRCEPVFLDGDGPAKSDDDARKFVQNLRPIRENGTPWEVAIWKRVNEKLDLWPHDGAKFGFAAGTKFSAVDIRCLYNESRYNEFSTIPIVHPKEPFLAFHASNWKNYPAIAKNNFHPRFTTDGWYGNGNYFTSNMIYSQHYIAVAAGAPMRGKHHTTLFQLPAVGHTIYIMGVMIKPGNSFFVSDMTLRDVDGVKAGYDSHHTHVVPKTHSVGMKPLGKEDRASAVADEYVMFDPKRVCPRFLIALRRDA